MIRLCYLLLATFCAVPTAGATTTTSSERVALLITDPTSPAGTCQYEPITKSLRDLRFSVEQLSAPPSAQALATYGEKSAKADASIVFACNPRDRAALPDILKARKLNFLFLLETTQASRGTPIENVIKTKRNDLVIVHARLGTPETQYIFAKTLAQKLLRQYSPPNEILSRAIVSSYYRSRGVIMTELHGSIASGYVLARPPTEAILDAWSRVQHSKDRAALEAFIAEYPKTLFADLARTRLQKLP